MTLPLTLRHDTCVSAHLEHVSTSAKHSWRYGGGRMLTFLLPSCRWTGGSSRQHLSGRGTIDGGQIATAQGRYQVVKQDMVAQGQIDCNEEVASKGKWHTYYCA